MLLDKLRSRLETLASEVGTAAEQAVTSKVQKLASIDGYNIGLSHLEVSFERPWLESETDVDTYLGSLREAMLDAIGSGKRIQV